MTYPQPLPDFAVVGLFDANVPNSERILLRPNRRTTLAGWGIAAGLRGADGTAFPVYDHVFWFPDLVVEPPAWIYVYTGNGRIEQTTMPNGEPALVFHWQRKETLFAHPDAVPVLFAVGYSMVVDRIAPVAR